MNVTAYLVVLAWSVWLGSITFFSFVVAPTAFGALDREAAARLMRAIFPRYYAVGIGCGILALLAALRVGTGLLLTGPLMISLVLAAFARQVLTPAANAARESGDEEAFSRIHVWSVRVNIVVLAMLLLAGTVLPL